MKPFIADAKNDATRLQAGSAELSAKFESEMRAASATGPSSK
jgi:hypothetical protein